MSVQEDLTVPYHQQDTNYYCGAACAQMVLAQIGAGLLDQTPLYNDNHAHSVIEPGWYTAPDGLKWTLNNRRPAAFANWFALFTLANEDSISRKIVWTIHHYKVAPVAMVWGSQHWIVVRGYDASAAPSNSGDTSYSINAFMVNNPWPPVPSKPPPPHSAGDGCGTGGTHGIADEHVSYSAWQSSYMTGVPGGYWQGKYIAVCDPEPPADRVGQQPSPPHRMDGERLLTSKEAMSRALDGLKSFGLLERDSWKKSLANTSPRQPILVQRLDRLDSFYYIVPMTNKTGKATPVLVSVDGRYGDYQQAISLSDRGADLLADLDFDSRSATKRVLGERIELGNTLGQLVFRAGAYCVYPTLVWKPCRESLSPFYPFHMITVGDHRIYVRVDGQVFTELHDKDRGI